MNNETLLRAETMLLDAATDPDAWQAALEMIARVTASKGAALLTVEGHGPLILPTEGAGELAERYVRDGWHQRDFRHAGVPLMKQRGIMVDQDFVAPERMARMDYYADFLRPMGFGWFAGLRVTPGDDLWCLTLQRGEDAGAYLVEEQLRLARLADVASRAATIARRLEFIKLDGAVDAVNAMSGSCLFLDRFGRVVRMTDAAERMVGKVFQLRQGHIRLPHGSARLDRHLAASVWPDLAADAAALRPVTISRPGERPLIFHAIRLRGNALGFLAPAYVMLTVTDLNEKTALPVDHLQTIFQLTPAEARLADALLQQFSLVDAASYLNSTHETVRTQIKTVFAKTGTRNQAELVDLLGRLRSVGSTPHGQGS